jgi:acetyltransferase-like isoleucine patch superfamily enzyme
MHKLWLIYTWVIRIGTFWLPDAPLFMKIRGALYAVGLKKCGKNFQVAHNVILNTLPKISIGNNVYFAPGCVVLGGGDIEIGNNVLFGPMCLISANNHIFNGEHFLSDVALGNVFVADNCWIAGNCSLLMGTHVKEKSLLAAGSVCNKELEFAQAVYGGIPVKYLKKVE